MLGTLVIDGISSNDYDLYLTDAGIYGMAERDSEYISVPGRNGDLIYDNGRYKNVKLSYPTIIRHHFSENYQHLMEFILSHKGYMRLEDSFNPDVFMLGKFTGETNAKKVDTYGKDGVFEMTFTRKPQRYLKSGEIPIEITSNTSIYNQYGTEALPLIRVYGTGILTIGEISVIINNVNEYVDIDCEMQEAYKGLINCNNDIVLSNGEFFKLVPGNNNITISGNITKIVITPKWWIL